MTLDSLSAAAKARAAELDALFNGLTAKAQAVAAERDAHLNAASLVDGLDSAAKAVLDALEPQTAAIPVVGPESAPVDAAPSEVEQAP
jgi:hypothetical protein